MGCPVSGVAQEELEIGWLDLWCPARYPFDLFTFGFQQDSRGRLPDTYICEELAVTVYSIMMDGVGVRFRFWRRGGF